MAAASAEEEETSEVVEVRRALELRLRQFLAELRGTAPSIDAEFAKDSQGDALDVRSCKFLNDVVGIFEADRRKRDTEQAAWRFRIEAEVAARTRQLDSREKLLEEREERVREASNAALSASLRSGGGSSEVAAIGADGEDATGRIYRTGSRFGSLHSGWKFGDAAAIRVSADRPVELVGVTTVGTEEGASDTYEGVLEIHLRGECVLRQEVCHSGREEELLLERRVPLDPHLPVDVVLTSRGPAGSFGAHARERLHVPLPNGDVVTWTFADSELDVSDTCVEGGQIPGFLFALR